MLRLPVMNESRVLVRADPRGNVIRLLRRDLAGGPSVPFADAIDLAPAVPVLTVTSITQPPNHAATKLPRGNKPALGRR
jgi:hypothetical protein